MSEIRRALIVLLGMTLLAPAGWSAQTKPAAKSQKKRPPATKKAPPPPAPVGFTDEARLLAEQLKLMNRFLYVYGRISAGLETADDRVELTKKNKASAVASIAAFRPAIEKVQVAFEQRPELQRQYLRLGAATDGVNQAEKLAASGQFDKAGRMMIEVAQRLADVLADMPGPAAPRVPAR